MQNTYRSDCHQTSYSLTHSLTPMMQIIIIIIIIIIIWKADCQLIKKYPTFFIEPKASLPCFKAPRIKGQNKQEKYEKRWKHCIVLELRRKQGLDKDDVKKWLYMICRGLGGGGGWSTSKHRESQVYCCLVTKLQNSTLI